MPLSGMPLGSKRRSAPPVREVVHIGANESLARWSAYSRRGRMGPCGRCFGLGARAGLGGVQVCECAMWGVEYERARPLLRAAKRLEALSSIPLPGDSRLRSGVWGMPVVESKIDAWWRIKRLV